MEMAKSRCVTSAVPTVRAAELALNRGFIAQMRRFSIDFAVHWPDGQMTEGPWTQQWSALASKTTSE
jgi:hypothetical protein